VPGALAVGDAPSGCCGSIPPSSMLSRRASA
jgi:hypothetical protein